MPIQTPSEWRKRDGTFGLERNRCPECGLRFDTQYGICPQCGTNEGIERTKLERTGTIMTYVVQHYLPEGFETPMVLALVETDDGGRVFGPVVDCSPSDVAVGQSVELGLRATAAERTAGPEYDIVFTMNDSATDGSQDVRTHDTSKAHIHD